MNYKLEICVDTVESAILAQEAGADRIELCNNLFEGGTTPGYGTIVSARDNLTIGLNVMIRPRGGDFHYSDPEYDIMRRDIDICGEIGVDGIVLGILNKDGTIDTDRTGRLIEYANPMPATFHRAFDLCSDPGKGLEDIISCGASRLLTSGQKNKAIEGAQLIKNLVKQAGKRIIIMVGSGISEMNISELANKTKATDFHLTGRKLIASEMEFIRDGILMGGIAGSSEYNRKVADPELIKNIVATLKML